MATLVKVSSILVFMFLILLLKLQNKGLYSKVLLSDKSMHEINERRDCLLKHLPAEYNIQQNTIRQRRETFINYRTEDGHHLNHELQWDNTTTGKVPLPSLCSIQVCNLDTFVNCTGRLLTEIRPYWFPRNTTVLLLDNNNIKNISHSSFSHMTNLRVISLSNNKIKDIETNTFIGLKNLEIINLESNELTINAFTSEFFIHLVDLRWLLLRYNNNIGKFSGNLFINLTKLEVLSIDVTDSSIIDKCELPSLTTLILSGNVRMISSESFTNVTNIINLVVENAPLLSNFSEDALNPLHSLDVLKVVDTFIGVEKTLATVKPLVGKNISVIYFRTVSFSRTDSYTTLFKSGGELDSEKTKYLTKICVKHFSLIHSYVYLIQTNALWSDTWNKCLKSLDMSENPLVGTRLAMVRLSNLKHLENLNLEKRSLPFQKKKIVDDEEKHYHPNNKVSNMFDKTTDKLSIQQGYGSTDKYLQSKLSECHKQSVYFLTKHNENISGGSPLENPSDSCPTNTHYTNPYFYSYPKIYISSSLKYIKFKRLFWSSGVSANIVFVGVNNLIYLDLSNNGFGECTGNISGLGTLKTFIFSENYLHRLSETFFDGMCHLEELDLSKCELDEHFMSHKSARIFQNLRYLNRLDISSNFLYALQSSTFASNVALQEIYMSKNRFRNIPFALKNTPYLKFLDLRENSITSLQSHEREELDNLAKQPGGFTLLLSGNILSCGCDSFHFLQWLHTTLIDLDNGRNLTCMTDRGELSSTGYAHFSDLEAFWRICWGKFFFSLALILLFCMLIGFLIVFVIWKNRTFIMSIFLQILTRYLQKKACDYEIGVYIGYADKDHEFPCHILRPFIENELQMKRTYIFHRDMDPSSDMASCIFDAINKSWRILLVFSENFLLNDEWSLFTMRTAVYAQSPVNPARVVVLVQENLQHRLPAEVLSSVPEDNIIVVPGWETTYELREKLRTRLMQS